MALTHKRCTSDEVVTFFRTTKSSNKESEQAEEYIVVSLMYLRDGESPQEVTNNKDLYCVIFCVRTHDGVVQFDGFLFRCLEEMFSFEWTSYLVSNSKYLN